MSNILDPDQARHFVEPYLGPNSVCKGYQQHTLGGKELNPNVAKVPRNPSEMKKVIYTLLSGDLITLTILRDLTVPFNTAREAEIACGSLSVDPEPKRGGVKKSMNVEENILNV